MKKSITPLIQQYLEIKEKYRDAILFYRLGDFYEMFFEDAIKAAPLLDLTLTARDKDAAEQVPMCGLPYHAAAPYIKRLIDNGLKVAICEQMEDPSFAKGIVKREVIRVVTPGLIYDPDMLEANQTNYISVILKRREFYAVAFFEFTTADLLLLETKDVEQVLSEIRKLMPKEMLYEDGFLPLHILEQFGNEVPFIITPLSRENFVWDTVKDRLLNIWGAQISIAGTGEHELVLSLLAGLFRYLEDTKTPISNVSMRMLVPSQYLYLDSTTIRNLELFNSIIEGSEKVSLIGVLDKTITPMGARMLRNYLRFPSISILEIRERQSVVQHFFEEPVLRNDVRQNLKEVGDIERVVIKALNMTITPQALERFVNSIDAVKNIKLLIKKDISLLIRLYESIDTIEDIKAAIKDTVQITEDQSIHGWFVKPGINRELDELKALVKDAKGWIRHFEKHERERTGIGSLKIGYSSVFGYYIEVTRTNLKLVPDDYIRKQTIASGERFITPQLKDMEVKLLSAEADIKNMENEYLKSMVSGIAAASSRILKTASAIASIDVLSTFAEIAVRNNYVKPITEEEDSIDIKSGRHPVIEQYIKDNAFIPNDIMLNSTNRQIIILTGPNMSGKSTVIRMTALIVLMAQVGSFVPASYARIGIVDRIFARVGASDHLAKGQSTYMVEMAETANILSNATKKSLIILDEIGRGTSTYDGISIAWAVLDYIANDIGAKTLFATHYHELIEFGQTHPAAVNQSIPVKQWQGKLIFLRKVVDGGSNESFGIEVARMAGLPLKVITLGRMILKKLQDGEIDSLGRPRLAQTDETIPLQLGLFKPGNPVLYDMLGSIDVDKITPLEALQYIVKMKEIIEKQKSGDKV